MSLNMSIKTMMGGIPISKRAINMIQQSPKLISAVESYAKDIQAGKAMGLNDIGNLDKSALYNMDKHGISTITVGSNLFPKLSTAEDDFFAVSMLAHELGHFQSLTLNKQKDYLETIKPTDEDLIRRFSKLNETACGSGTSTNLATPPLSYREAYTQGATSRRNSVRSPIRGVEKVLGSEKK